MSFQRFYILGRLLALGIIPLCVGVSRAETFEEALVRDLWQTVQARKMLLDDPQLGQLNLGVKVSNRMAVLWGPVPSQELSFRAEQKLRGMVELVEVRNALTIEPTSETWLPITRLSVPEQPRYLPEQVPQAVPNELQAGPFPGRVPKPRGGPGGNRDRRRIPHGSFLRSPLGYYSQVEVGQATLHFPFLGSITLPR